MRRAYSTGWGTHKEHTYLESSGVARHVFLPESWKGNCRGMLKPEDVQDKALGEAEGLGKDRGWHSASPCPPPRALGCCIQLCLAHVFLR